MTLTSTVDRRRPTTASTVTKRYGPSATLLVNTAHDAVMDLYCSTKRPDSRTIGPHVALRNASDLVTLAADSGYEDMSFRGNLRTEDIRPLIKHRVFAPYDHAHNARIDDDRYNQRSVCETVKSVIKRVWYRQFREITLVATVYNVEQTSNRESRRSLWIQ